MTISGLYKTNHMRFAGIILSYLLASLTLILNSYLLMYLVEYIKNRDLRHWLQFFVLEIIVSISSYLFPRLATYLTQKQIQEYDHLIRQKIIRSYYVQNSEVSVAIAQNHLINDLNILNDSYLSNFFYVISDALTIVFAALTLLLIHWLLLLVTLVIVGFSLLLPKILKQSLTNVTNQLSSNNQKYFYLLQNWLGGIDELRRYLAGGHLFKVAEATQTDLAQANVAYQEKTQLVQIINGFSSNLFSLVIYLVTGLLIQNKMVLFGTIIAIGNFHYYISGAIEDINFSLQKMKGSRGLNDTVIQECVTKFKNKKNYMTDVIGIQLHQLSYTYDKNKISFPDLKIDPGEKVLLTGINGRGKSTLLSLIAGDKPNFEGEIRFLTHDGFKSNFEDLQINYMRQKVKLFPGNIFLDDFNYNDVSDKQLHESVAYVEQTPYIFDASLRWNLTLGNKVEKDKLTELVKQTGLSALVKELPDGLDSKLDIHKLSGGQKQRISFARALLREKPIYLLDEFTSSLDKEASLDLEKLMMSKKNMTVVMITHHLEEETKESADRVINISEL